MSFCGDNPPPPICLHSVMAFSTNEGGRVMAEQLPWCAQLEWWAGKVRKGAEMEKVAWEIATGLAERTQEHQLQALCSLLSCSSPHSLCLRAVGLWGRQRVSHVGPCWGLAALNHVCGGFAFDMPTQAGELACGWQGVSSARHTGLLAGWLLSIFSPPAIKDECKTNFSRLSQLGF